MKIFLQIVQMLPGIIEAVKAAESFIPLPGQGKAKLDFVLGLIEDAYGDIKPLVEVIVKVIARLVTLAKATGVFS